MPKYLNGWNTLNSIPKGTGLRKRTDYLHGIAVNLHYYASIMGLIVAVAPYVLNFFGIV